MKFEDYKIIRKIGSGPASTVHLVRKLTDGQLFAAKIYESNKCSNKDWNQFQNEAIILFSNKHPTILKLYETYMRKDCFILITQYCLGGTLSGYIQRAQQELPQNKIVDMMVQICMGLDFLHRHGIIHRDIKSSNILINERGRVKIGDFGASRVVRANQLVTSTAGTPTHLAPEMYSSDYGFEAHKGFSDKVDMWALGVVLYEMCTRTLPFTAECMNDLMKKIISGRFGEIKVSSYSPWLVNLIESLLSTNQSLRPSANQILQMLPVRKRIRQFLEEQKQANQKKAPERQLSPHRLPISPLKNIGSRCKDRSTGVPLASNREMKEKVVSTKMFQVEGSNRTQRLRNTLENLLFSKIEDIAPQRNPSLHNHTNSQRKQSDRKSLQRYHTPEKHIQRQSSLNRHKTEIPIQICVAIPVIQNIEQFYETSQEEKIHLPCDEVLLKIGLSPKQIMTNKAFLYPGSS